MGDEKHDAAFGRGLRYVDQWGAHGVVELPADCGCRAVGAGHLKDPLRVQFCEAHKAVVVSLATKFEAVLLEPEGWAVLSPWIEAPDRTSYRHHIWIGGSKRVEHKAWAFHLACQLNGEVI